MSAPRSERPKGEDRRSAEARRYLAEAQDRTPRLYIGEVAARTGASRKAIRYYESLGLLPPAARQGRYRVYSGRDVFLVHVIKHAQRYGFSLGELRELVAAIARERRFPLKAALDAVERKRVAVRRQAAALRTLDRRLGGLLTDIARAFG
jgi:DNA-binding transcriptional MerR regulator